MEVPSTLHVNEGKDIVYGVKWTPQAPFITVFMYIDEDSEYKDETALLTAEFP